VTALHIPPGLLEADLDTFARVSEDALRAGGTATRQGDRLLYRDEKGELVAYSCSCDVRPWARRRFVRAGSAGATAGEVESLQEGAA